MRGNQLPMNLFLKQIHQSLSVQRGSRGFPRRFVSWLSVSTHVFSHHICPLADDI
jgi:hypothetical protein